ncbi:probable lysophospholipase BODYGUARD 1 [Zingiber officinale]|uniref:AB hydrolase-1 domain-containing protein n=1 Tax=Zingiber officinale TaxID=94328 RepID=A0A8J5HUN8_ZINOF|nr:probable lysophospholipase BODYGUARD 1 [Zingiber officinale]KAG6525589.1 hypothetical protein ZIOFF_015551 [Zingiber officinale]
MGTLRRAAAIAGRAANDLLGFLVFTLLDLLDLLLCFSYKLADYAAEAQWKPCYCFASPGRGGAGGSGGVFVLSVLSSTKLQLEDISDTLFRRPSVVSDVARAALQKLNVRRCPPSAAAAPVRVRPTRKGDGFTVNNSTVVRMPQGKVGGDKPSTAPCWSDCHCDSCCPRGSPDELYVYVECPTDGKAAKEDVLFIHGFISSSAFWTETVFRHLSADARSRYRLLAVDLLGFGKSPKPSDSLYTLREHVDTIDRSVLRRYGVKSFHLVGHSLGSLLALALAAKHPAAVKSITILAPPYFPVPKGVQRTQYLLRRVAPRRVWPLITFGASVICWYEHISRTVCLVLCKHHRFWEKSFKLATRNRVRTYLMDGFFCHAHHASWHTMHNILCGSSGRVEEFMDAVRERLSCDVVVFHGKGDELLPVECSYAVKARIPRARVEVVDGVDHITVVVGRQKVFAGELEEIWRNAKAESTVVAD